LRKLTIFILFLIVILSMGTIAYAEGYKIDGTLTQETIEQDEYYQEDAQLIFLNDTLKTFGFEEIESIETFKEGIQESWTRIPLVYYAPRIKPFEKPINSIFFPFDTFESYELIDVFPKESILNSVPVQNMANQDKLVLLVGENDNVTDVYFVHPSEENTNNNILYTTIVSTQNWYNLKTKVSALIDEYDTINAYYCDYPDPFEDRDLIGYVNINAVNFRNEPIIDEDTYIREIGYSKEVQIIGENTAWYKVILNGNMGYVYKKYITLGNYPTPTPTPKPTPNITATPKPTPKETSNETPVPVSSSNIVERFLSVAMAQLGKPYVWGAQGANSFDCSGFVYYCMKSIGLNYTRTNANSYAHMSGWNYFSDRSKLSRGDLVFFYNDGRSRIQHIGIYIGNNQIIHASSGKGKVVVANLSEKWLNNHYAYACSHYSVLGG